MQAIDPDAGRYVKKIFPERDVIFELKILFELFGLENEFFLEKINNDGKQNNAADDIPDKMGQSSSGL